MPKPNTKKVIPVIKNKVRPTFYLDDEKTIELRAGGILFYKYNEDKTNFDMLMIKSREKYEDFGGCTDILDKDIYDTISREVEEESNGIIKKHEVRKLIENQNPIYIKHCKYALFIVETNIDYIPKDFGNLEIHDNIERTVEWISYDQTNDSEFKKKLNFRLTSYNVLNYLKSLKDN
jgi:hypothetical protein